MRTQCASSTPRHGAGRHAWPRSPFTCLGHTTHTNRAPALRPPRARTRSLPPTMPAQRCVQRARPGAAADAGSSRPRGACCPACMQPPGTADARALAAPAAMGYRVYVACTRRVAASDKSKRNQTLAQNWRKQAAHGLVTNLRDVSANILVAFNNLVDLNDLASLNDLVRLCDARTTRRAGPQGRATPGFMGTRPRTSCITRAGTVTTAGPGTGARSHVRADEGIYCLIVKRHSLPPHISHPSSVGERFGNRARPRCVRAAASSARRLPLQLRGTRHLRRTGAWQDWLQVRPQVGGRHVR